MFMPSMYAISSSCLSALQDATVELLLRHPRLASTPKQLSHLSALVTDLPESISIPREQLQQVLVKRPNLVRYSSPKALAAKVTALKPLFPGQAGVRYGEGNCRTCGCRGRATAQGMCMSFICNARHALEST